MVETSASGWRQARAEVRLDATQTVAIQSDESVFLDRPFAPIAPYARHRVEVRVTGADGITGDWSDPVEVRAVFVPEKIGGPDFIALAEPPTAAAPALLRAEFDIDRAVASATLFSTARGVYQAVVNGQDVDDAVLKPGWTVYQSRLLHDAVDVTALVRSGRNALADPSGRRMVDVEEWGFAGAGQRFYGEQPDALASCVWSTSTEPCSPSPRMNDGVRLTGRSYRAASITASESTGESTERAGQNWGTTTRPGRPLPSPRGTSFLRR